MRARQTKTKQAPKTTHNQNHAQPPGPWHKKHDTLSSFQTTHPPRFQLGKNSLLASRRRPDYHKQVVVRESNSDRVTLISELFCFFRTGRMTLPVQRFRCPVPPSNRAVASAARSTIAGPYGLLSNDFRATCVTPTFSGCQVRPPRSDASLHHCSTLHRVAPDCAGSQEARAREAW